MVHLDMDASTLRALTDDICEAANRAAEFIRSQVGEVTDSDIEAKERNSLVSYVDKNAERMLVEDLERLLPDPGFITEEDTVANKRNKYTWIIDPLDGTTNFLQQIPIFSVSVGLAYHGEIVSGAVVDVMQEETYYAWKGGGAWRDGREIRVSGTANLSEAIIATGFPYFEPDKLMRLAELFKDVLTASRGIRRLGSAALDLTYVASGKMDAFYETTLNPWDIAGGTILVREAGGMVTDFQGQDGFVDKRQLIASNAILHDHISALLADFVDEYS